MSQKSCCSTAIPEPKPEEKKPGLSAYTPLFVIILLTAGAAAAKQSSYPAWSWHVWMHDFMGLFLVIFAMVKLFNLRAFATGFAVSIAQYLPTIFVGAGRFATLTTEAVALASGSDRRLMAVMALWQQLLPLIVFALATLIPAYRFRHRRAMSQTAS